MDPRAGIQNELSQTNHSNRTGLKSTLLQVHQRPLLGEAARSFYDDTGSTAAARCGVGLDAPIRGAATPLLMAPKAPRARPAIDGAGIEHLRRVIYPALVSGPVDFLDGIAARLTGAGVQRAVAERNTAPIYDWLMTLVSLQGISDRVALAWDAEHGGITWAEVNATLHARPSCPRLRSWGRFQGCGYRKGRGTCVEPGQYQSCPLPKRALRKGGLNVAAFSLALFIRDVCAGDFVAWLDASLAHADPGLGSAGPGSPRCGP